MIDLKKFEDNIIIFLADWVSYTKHLSLFEKKQILIGILDHYHILPSSSLSRIRNLMRSNGSINHVLNDFDIQYGGERLTRFHRPESLSNYLSSVLGNISVRDKFIFLLENK